MSTRIWLCADIAGSNRTMSPRGPSSKATKNQPTADRPRTSATTTVATTHKNHKPTNIVISFLCLTHLLSSGAVHFKNFVVGALRWTLAPLLNVAHRSFDDARFVEFARTENCQ